MSTICLARSRGVRGHSGAAFGRSLHLSAHSSASSEWCMARREAEICARTFWLREDEAELCPIEHFRKDTDLLRPAHMTAAFSSLRLAWRSISSGDDLLSCAFSLIHCQPMNS